MLNENIFTLKEIAVEVEKLLKFTMEMQSLTRYKGGEPANTQKLSLWVYTIKKGGTHE